jgi:hypothetical protein
MEAMINFVIDHYDEDLKHIEFAKNNKFKRLLQMAEKANYIKKPKFLKQKRKKKQNYNEYDDEYTDTNYENKTNEMEEANYIPRFVPLQFYQSNLESSICPGVAGLLPFGGELTPLHSQHSPASQKQTQKITNFPQNQQTPHIQNSSEPKLSLKNGNEMIFEMINSNSNMSTLTEEKTQSQTQSNTNSNKIHKYPTLSPSELQYFTNNFKLFGKNEIFALNPRTQELSSDSEYRDLSDIL